MNADDVLQNLLNLSAENEVVEFKEAKNNFDLAKLGKYFSALSNEANLMHKDRAWLAFGVNNSRKVVGTLYRRVRKDLDSLKEEVAKQTTNRISFVEIHEVEHELGRVILFEIPAAPKGMPVAFGGHYYGREGSALSALNSEEYERIRSQVTQEDWSAVVVPEAGIDDLDEEALVVGRQNFKSKFPSCFCYCTISTT
jgi:ATP-dependent DNA helicase RecG